MARSTAWTHPATMFAALLASLSACGGSGDDSLNQGQRSLDAAAADGGDMAEDSQADATLGSDPDASSDGDVDASTTTDPDAALTSDADGPDATELDADAPDASEPDASEPDAGNPARYLYATFDDNLVRIDIASAQSQLVGKVRNEAMETQTFAALTMAWIQGNDALLVINNSASPRLGTLDLCSGLVVLGPQLSRPNSPNLIVEGLARHPDGTWYVSAGNLASPTSPLTASTHVGRLDVETGAITNLGMAVDTAYQDDVDVLFFVGSVLYGVDLDTPNSRLQLDTISLSNGANALVRNSSYGSGLTPLRFAYDDVSGQLFAWRLPDRQLLTFDLSNSTATPVGETHPSTSYGNQPSRGFTFAPGASCP